jgi:hypothetical protein
LCTAWIDDNLPSILPTLASEIKVSKVRCNAADAAKPANASHYIFIMTLIESSLELQHGNPMGKVDAIHGLLNALLVLRYHFRASLENHQENVLLLQIFHDNLPLR